ncbi:fungal-specific transcription factor domain-containing protein [Penicillium atrosanguineum]|uniref:Fungal-specific transcription factor domain-containing protein n=1 Tax=Penicillium atrosanguineum TaxID=1132637 RepID=A0A9W9TZM5_9EURO|nr:fungal-specific transcription factor domain-containing protein [Penicillium atrosanguineum]
MVRYVSALQGKPKDAAYEIRLGLHIVDLMTKKEQLSKHYLLKCDRRYPCETCVVRCQPCCFANPKADLEPVAKNRHRLPTSCRRRIPSQLYARIDQLERRVAYFAQATVGHEHHDTDDTTGSDLIDMGTADEMPLPTPSQPSSSLHSEGDKVSFADASHWATILNDIAGIKYILHPHEKHPGTSPPSRSLASHEAARPEAVEESKGFTLLLESIPPATTGELFCSLPSVPMINLLIDTVIQDESLFALMSTIHPSKVKAECAAAFRDPETITLPWLGVVFGLLTLALQSASRASRRIEGFPLLEESAKLYILRTVQCIRGSNYTKPTSCTVNAMLLYLACEYHYNADDPFSASIVLNITIRLAFQLGYHRDPRNFPEINAFDCEMRRATWWFIVKMDLTLSAKCGHPRSIDERQTDTVPPDLSEGLDPLAKTTESSTNHVASEPTIAGYLHYRALLLAKQGEITDRVNSPRGIGWQDIQSMDAALNAQIDKSPSWWYTLQAESNLSPQKLQQTVELDLIVQRSRMLLHRAYLVGCADRDPAHAYSRKVCTEAAQKTLQHQKVLAQAGVPSLSHFISFNSHDFLFAAALICADLSQSDMASRDAHLLALLHQSHDVWVATKGCGRIAKRAVAILEAILQKLQAGEAQMTPLCARNSQLITRGADIRFGGQPLPEMPDMSMTSDDVLSAPNNNDLENMLAVSDLDIDWLALCGGANVAPQESFTWN